jgi:cyclophilin family peptidyl-prolyl cis-trans isomerase
MPHSSRKHRRPEQRSGGVGRRKGSLSSATTYIVIGIVIAIIIAVGGFYAYNSMRSTTTNGNPQSTALKYANPVTTVILVGETSVTLTMNKSGSSELIYGQIVTSMGTMEIELFPQAAPKTVANFVMLAKSGFYNNLVWHRIVSGFVIQTGDPNTRNGGGDRSTWGEGGSSTTVPLEIDSDLHNYVGYIGLARSTDPNSGSSQFYINLANNTSLDGQYTVFGKVISGMDVAYSIAGVQVNSQDQPINPVFVNSITIYDN